MEFEVEAAGVADRLAIVVSPPKRCVARSAIRALYSRSSDARLKRSSGDRGWRYEYSKGGRKGEGANRVTGATGCFGFPHLMGGLFTPFNLLQMQE